ncbi:TPA: site-specific integrase, partial [Legionella pneumophila]|nr:site-specific integrase [Legionella pneumophila]
CENRKSGVILTLLRNPKSRPASQNTLRESQVSL